MSDGIYTISKPIRLGLNEPVQIVETSVEVVATVIGKTTIVLN